MDIREFRSSLPSLLHKSGIDIIPLTLEVSIVSNMTWWMAVSYVLIPAGWRLCSNTWHLCGKEECQWPHWLVKFRKTVRTAWQSDYTINTTNTMHCNLNLSFSYNQATAMTRHYKRPVLLIEFEESKSFSLQVRESLMDHYSTMSLKLVFYYTECISLTEWNILQQYLIQVGVAHLTLSKCRSKTCSRDV